MTKKKTSPKILFVCAWNKWRSPTAERMFARDKRIRVKSAGVKDDSVYRIESKDLDWADLVICFEEEQKNAIEERFIETEVPKIEVLGITDDFGFMDPNLVEDLDEKVLQILESNFTFNK